jgi:preprotein translocase subunit SecA
VRVLGERLRDKIARFVDSTRPGSLAVYQDIVAKVGQAEQDQTSKTDAELTKAATALRDTDLDRVALCALGREAADRTLGLRPYDVQLLGTLAMLDGHVLQMATGEGKTLVGALAAAGYAMRGRQVHVVSVNDYLAQRDAEWMGPAYEMLGLSVSWIGQQTTRDERREAYQADVTYVSVSELGFDVLRDRLCTSVADLVVPEPGVVLVDEADSVLVDEARVPLILAGTAEQDDTDQVIAKIVRRLRLGEHYEIDEQARNVYLTDTGADRVEQAMGGIDLYAPETVNTLAAVNVSLHAHALLQRDVDYLVRDGKVRLINTSRGRVAELQRWPDGLQAAVEAKEHLAVTDSGEVLDSMTVQALIKRYPTVCGMTGTATAVARQLREFYNLTVRAAEPNRPCVRVDEPDRVYATDDAKQAAIVAHIEEVHATGRPILIGTLDVAESERLARRLAKNGLDCVVLNARNDASEAAIIAEAGAYNAITVSTQMAGRGTDIRLGGADGTSDADRVTEAGGLYVLGTGRHSSSRLDDQLRGRSGRQGDPGGSVFFTSLEDDLVQRHAPETAAPSKTDEDGRVLDKGAAWAIQHAQRVAEGVDLEIHRNTWRYNQLIAQQRTLVLIHRDKILRTDVAATDLRERRSPDRYAELEAEVGAETLAEAAKQIALYHLDRCWTEHLAYLTDIREAIHLHALSREDPLTEFHRAAVTAFRDLLSDAADRSVTTFESADITVEGIDLDQAGLKRPTATWTYLVHDNPFGSDIDRSISGIAARVRKKRQ